MPTQPFDIRNDVLCKLHHRSSIRSWKIHSENQPNETLSHIVLDIALGMSDNNNSVLALILIHGFLKEQSSEVLLHVSGSGVASFLRQTRSTPSERPFFRFSRIVHIPERAQPELLFVQYVLNPSVLVRIMVEQVCRRSQIVQYMRFFLGIFICL